jgi:hypothetical protein
MSKKKKTATAEYPHKDSHLNSKKTVRNETPVKVYDITPVWSFGLFDASHETWGLSGKDLCKYINAMKNFSNQTWGIILTDNSGKAHGTRSHPIPVENLISKARERLKELKLDDYDELISIRIASRVRIWGMFHGTIFNILWLDDNHEICPSLKKG